MAIISQRNISTAFTTLLIVWVIGIFFSRFLQSTSMVLMSVLFIFSVNKLSINYKHINNGLTIGLWCIFLVYVISFINSENIPNYLTVIKNKIPYLFIPISLISIRKLTIKSEKIIIAVFISSSIISTYYSLYFFIPHQEIYKDLYGQGQVIPTLIHHVTFSLLLSFSVLFLMHLFFNSKYFYEKMSYLFLVIYLSCFIHILSVRTGIVLLYVGVLIYLVTVFLQRKKYGFIFLTIFILILTAIFSYKNIPTLQSKIDYTIYGLTEYKTKADSANQISDSRRLLSDKIGWEIIDQHKLTGVGIGDLKSEIHKVYKQNYPEFNEAVYAHIHNQYLYMLAGTGIPLGILFIVGLILPLLYFIKRRKLLYSTLYFLLLLVMLWEPFLENQIGTSIFLLVCCLGFSQK